MSATWHSRVAVGALVGAGLMLACACRRRPPEAPPGAKTATTKPDVLHAEPPRPFRLVRSLAVDLERLTGIAVDAQGRIHAVGQGGVRVLGPDGREQHRWTTSGPATCVALDADGFVYVGQKTRVQRFDANGKLVAEWGKAGTQSGQLRHVTGIAVVDTNVLVADAGNRCVHRFDITGDFIGDLGRKDAEAGVPGLIVPSPFLDVAVAPGGEAVVTNPGCLRVERYSLNGKLLGWWGRASFRPEGFCGCCNPVRLAVDARGRVVTAEKGLVRIKLYDATGTLLAMVSDDVMPKGSTGMDLAVDAAGRVYVSDPTQGKVHVFVEASAGKR